MEKGFPRTVKYVDVFVSKWNIFKVYTIKVIISRGKKITKIINVNRGFSSSSFKFRFRGNIFCHLRNTMGGHVGCSLEVPVLFPYTRRTVSLLSFGFGGCKLR